MDDFNPHQETNGIPQLKNLELEIINEQNRVVIKERYCGIQENKIDQKLQSKRLDQKLYDNITEFKLNCQKNIRSTRWMHEKSCFL